MKKNWPIIKDALILLFVSTLFVTVCNYLFKGLKKSAGSDPLVTAVHQDDEKRVAEVLNEVEFKKDGLGASSYEDYLKARVTYMDDQKRTALMWVGYINVSDSKAVRESDPKRAAMVETIVKAGANINARDEHQWTALMWASWSGLNGTVAKLLELGADASAADQKGNTALAMAAQRGNVDVVRELLAKGASPSVSDASGRTARDLALKGMAEYPEKAKVYQKILEMLGT
jgi:ankyrin repeat protein